MIALLGAGDDTVARRLGEGLRDLGAVVVVGELGTSPDEVHDVLRGAVVASGPLEAVVLTSAGTAAAGRKELAALDPAEWTERVERPLGRTLAFFQGAHRHLRRGGGSLVVIVPTLALVGAAGYTPWSAVAEGQRSLAKAAARAWGAEGIRVITVAVPASVLLSSHGDGPDRPGQPPPSLRSPRLGREVAHVVASVVDPGWNGVTGATIAVDGGVWMTP